MTVRCGLLVFTWLCAAATASAQQRDYLVRAYKQVEQESLLVHIFRPNAEASRQPAILLLHGGGFVWGGPEHTHGAARRYAARGVVAFAVEYRLADRNRITPLDQLDDTFAAIRWVRAHAGEFGLDVSRIVTLGVSAGGYLAAMAANSPDSMVRPNALVLWSPGVGAADDPYFAGLLLGRADPGDVSPLKRVQTPAVPAVIISGAQDSVTFESDARTYCAALNAARGHCVLHSYADLGHTLTRRLDARSQLQGRFDWDPVAIADAEEKVLAFLRLIGIIR